MKAAEISPGGELVLSVLLDELGFGGANLAEARAALEEAGLTRPGRQRIAGRKRGNVETLLRGRFVLCCASERCLEAARRTPRTPLRASRAAACEICGGSANRTAVDRLCEVLLERRIRKVVVVGGSPGAREALSDLIAGRVELRMVDGAARRTRRDAQADLLWADLVIVWGGTQLDHKVSQLYTPGGDARVVAVHRRGVALAIEELLAAWGG